MKKLLFLVFVAALFSINGHAQPRPVASSGQTNTVKPAPESFSARYEGGMMGFTKREDGTLKFDDANERLVFFGKDGKEMFSFAYESLLTVYPQSQSVTSTTGNVVKYIPLPGAGLAGFIKEKRRYMVIQFDDPDVDVKGLANFRLDDKNLLDSVLQTLAEKAKLTQRGDAYYRPKAPKPGS